MGWNDVEIRSRNPIFKDLNTPKFYFLHSFYFEPESEKSIIGETYYGTSFASILNSNNIFAAQFHPEKNHHFGEKILLNFYNT